MKYLLILLLLISCKSKEKNIAVSLPVVDSTVCKDTAYLVTYFDGGVNVQPSVHIKGEWAQDSINIFVIAGQPNIYTGFDSLPDFNPIKSYLYKNGAIVPYKDYYDSLLKMCNRFRKNYEVFSIQGQQNPVFFINDTIK